MAKQIPIESKIFSSKLTAIIMSVLFIISVSFTAGVVYTDKADAGDIKELRTEIDRIDLVTIANNKDLYNVINKIDVRLSRIEGRMNIPPLPEDQN